MSSHQRIDPEDMPPPRGFSHAVVPASGKTVYLGGQAGHRPDGTLAGPGLMEQLEQALANVVTALRAAGGDPEHLVSVQVFVTDAGAYRARLRDIGGLWRRHLGPLYPAVALVEVSGLFDPDALVELVCVAVVPS
jgi:enamine deaminase RidA (YjgF/YER057c/UK114 family)